MRKVMKEDAQSKYLLEWTSLVVSSDNLSMRKISEKIAFVYPSLRARNVNCVHYGISQFAWLLSTPDERAIRRISVEVQSSIC